MYSPLKSLTFFLLAALDPSVGLSIALAPWRPTRAFLERSNTQRTVSISDDEGVNPPPPAIPPFINSRRSVLSGSVAAGFGALYKCYVASTAARNVPFLSTIGEPVISGGPSLVTVGLAGLYNHEY